jgi:hypothetical protein
MLKRIPKSDITIRPFKAYKTWNFLSGSNDISIFEAEEGDYSSTTTTTSNGLTLYKNALFGQIKAQFYTDTYNPFKRSGKRTNNYYPTYSFDERYLGTQAKIISIPQKYIGDGIKPQSVTLTVKDSATNETFIYTDDGYSNIGYNYMDVLDVSKLDFQTGEFNFTNYYTGTVYSVSVLGNTWDLENGSQVTITSGGIDYTTTFYKWDTNTTPSLMYLRNLEFIDSPSNGNVVPAGNVFYNHGLIVLTKNSDALLTTTWSLSFKSTETIFEHEYLLVVNEDEFNISTNPTATVSVGEVSEMFTDSNGRTTKVVSYPGVKYVRKRQLTETGEYLDYSYTSSINSAISGGFEQFELSGSIDLTGSFLAPFITTIGLYNDDCELVAVAKLPQPIKSMPDVPINFIIRFDT